MRLLSKEEIIFLNKNNLARFGGNFVEPYNLLHESSLDYLVGIASGEHNLETVQAWLKENTAKK